MKAQQERHDMTTTPDFLRAGEAQADARQAQAEAEDERWQAKLQELHLIPVIDLLKRVHTKDAWLRLVHILEDQAMHELREGDTQ
jgi:hypothetical protein